MILRKSAFGYRVRWREGSALRQETVRTYEAARRLNARKVLRKRGGQRRYQPDALDPKIKVKDYAVKWLTDLQVQPKTAASYEETVDRYIVRPGVGIGDLQVRAVEREDIEDMLKQANLKSRAGALSRNTLRIIRAVSSSLLEAATRVRVPDGGRLIDANPCRGIKLSNLFGAASQPQGDGPSTIRVMDYPEITRFLQTARKHCSRRDYTLFHVLSDCGLRPSEALALQWSDVDFDGRMLRVARATTLGGMVKSTKTGHSRVVPLTDPVVEALAAWRKQVIRERLQKSEFLFGARQTGRPLNVRRVGRLFRALLREAKVGRFKLYDLRHTYASHLLDQGIKPVDVADVLGHKNVATTLAFYAHRVPRDMGYIADRLTAARRSIGDLNR